MRRWFRPKPNRRLLCRE